MAEPVVVSDAAGIVLSVACVAFFVCHFYLCRLADRHGVSLRELDCIDDDDDSTTGREVK